MGGLKVLGKIKELLRDGVEKTAFLMGSYNEKQCLLMFWNNKRMLFIKRNCNPDQDGYPPKMANGIWMPSLKGMGSMDQEFLHSV